MITPTPILDQIAVTIKDRHAIVNWIETSLGTAHVLEIPTSCTLSEVKARTKCSRSSTTMINDHQFIGFKELDRAGTVWFYNPEKQVYWVKGSKAGLIDSDAVLNYLLREF